MKNLLKRIAQMFGLKLLKIDTPMRSLDIGLKQLAERISPSHIVDVGVDYGSPELYNRFPSTKHQYVLIEADPANADRLKSIAQRLNARPENVFAGTQEGSVTLYTASNHAYSTAYKLVGKDDFTPVQVHVKTLDSILAPELSQHPSLLLKIDVEGAEMDVLKGAAATLKHTVAIVVELSIAKKFEGGAEFGEAVCFLREHGFSIFDLCSGFDRNGKLYQVDAIFVRTDSPIR